jgi:arylsulfatase A-like enzyme
MTNRAIEFMEQAGDEPWCLHLSYIKPHWPYIAPAPYHSLYHDDAILPVERDEGERTDPHPVFEAFMQMRYSRAFEPESQRRAVVGAYMGLVKQIDDEIGRILAHLTQTGLIDNTLIVFTSDHGDYLGDHWLGEKDLFHEPSVRVPLIIADPSESAEATRGTVETRFVEAIDLLPTFLDVAGGTPQPQRLEGRSLLPLLQDASVADWRDFTVSEIDYSGREVRHLLSLKPEDCRAFMLRTARWKYILHEQFRPQLYDLDADPQEFVDLGADPAYATVRRDLHEKLFKWLRRRKLRTTGGNSAENEPPYIPGHDPDAKAGIFIGYW